MSAGLNTVLMSAVAILAIAYSREVKWWKITKIVAAVCLIVGIVMLLRPSLAPSATWVLGPAVMVFGANALIGYVEKLG